MFEIKNIPAVGNITDLDEKANTVSGYFAVFGNLDAHGDVIMPGAFKKSLSENQRILHLYDHDPAKPLSSVRSGNLSLKEDARGLAFTSKITPTTWGKDVLMLIRDRVLNENSIGYTVMQKAQTKSGRELRELKLWEGSSLAFAANPLALMNTKSLNDTNEIVKRLDIFQKAYRDGRYTDETFGALEIYVQQLKAAIDQKSTPPVAKTVEPAIDQAVIAELRAVNKLFAVR